MEKSTISNDHQTTYKKFWIMTEYILKYNQEERFVKFLKELQHNNEFKDMQQEIHSFIEQYEITDEDVFAEISALA